MMLLLSIIFIISILLINIVILSNVINKILSSFENIFNLLHRNLSREYV